MVEETVLCPLSMWEGGEEVDLILRVEDIILRATVRATECGC